MKKAKLFKFSYNIDFYGGESEYLFAETLEQANDVCENKINYHWEKILEQLSLFRDIPFVEEEVKLLYERMVNWYVEEV